jgi:hypothetical protein
VLPFSDFGMKFPFASMKSTRGLWFQEQEPSPVSGVWSAAENNAMADKFDPAPTDKHADTPKERSAADKKADDELKKGLKDSFPASDPPSNTQPSKTGGDDG